MAFDQPKSSENRDGFCFDTILALAKRGPLSDGDVPSKLGRDDLLELGFAVRVVVNGEDGFTALTYTGRDFFTKYMECDTLKEALEKQRQRFEQASRDEPLYHHV